MVATWVKILVKDNKCVGGKAISQMAKDGLGGRIEITINMQKFHRARVSFDEWGQRIFKPADN
jgi:hypothetical protein